MGLIEGYVIFALSAAIASWYLFYLEALRFAKHIGVTNNITEHPVLSSITFILLCTIIAPVLVVPLLGTESGKRFKMALAKSIFELE